MSNEARKSIYREIYKQVKSPCPTCRYETKYCFCKAQQLCFIKRHNIIRAAYGYEEPEWLRQARLAIEYERMVNMDV